MNQIHCFESAGLGKAPFKFIGIAEIPSPSLCEVNPDAYRNMLRELPPDFGCGTCRYCGMPIKYNFLIVSSDGNKFSVGCECVRKTGDDGLRDAVKSAQRQALQEKRAAARRASYEKAAAAHEAALDAERNLNGGWLDKEYDEAAKINAQMDKAKVLAPIARLLTDGKGGFCDSVAADMLGGRVPSDRCLDIVKDILGKAAGRRGSAKYWAERDRISLIIESLEE